MDAAAPPAVWASKVRPAEEDSLLVQGAAEEVGGGARSSRMVGSGVKVDVDADVVENGAGEVSGVERGVVAVAA